MNNLIFNHTVKVFCWADAWCAGDRIDLLLSGLLLPYPYIFLFYWYTVQMILYFAICCWMISSPGWSLGKLRTKKAVALISTDLSTSEGDSPWGGPGAGRALGCLPPGMDVPGGAPGRTLQGRGDLQRRGVTRDTLLRGEQEEACRHRTWWIGKVKAQMAKGCCPVVVVVVVNNNNSNNSKK